MTSQSFTSFSGARPLGRFSNDSLFTLGLRRILKSKRRKRRAPNLLMIWSLDLGASLELGSWSLEVSS